MASGDKTPAKRCESYEEFYATDEPAYWKVHGVGGNDYWNVRLPTGETASALIHPTDGWREIEHSDGTITLDPSIWFNQGGRNPAVQEWHGWLRQGVFVEA